MRDLSQIGLGDLSVEEVAYRHLSTRGWEPIKGYTLFTTLENIETEMRQSRGAQLTSRYVPMLAAFSILEQLGDTYEDRRLPKHPTNGSGIERALYYFCGMQPMSDEVKAL